MNALVFFKLFFINRRLSNHRDTLIIRGHSVNNTGKEGLTMDCQSDEQPSFEQSQVSFSSMFEPQPRGGSEIQLLD